MKYTVTDSMVGDSVREIKREYEFDNFEDFQEFLFITGASGDTDNIVLDIISGMSSGDGPD